MKTVRRVLKTTCLLAAGFCLSVLAAPRAGAQVMDQVPSDSLAVIKINHLADTNKKVADLLQSLGVTDLVPTMKDPLQALEDELGVGEGIDTKRDAAAAILNGDFDNHNGPPPFVLLLPVSDYKAFLGTLTLVRTEGDVSVVHFKDKEEDAFVENWGTYAALSDKKENVSGKHEGIKVSGLTAKQLDGQDLCVYLNFPAMKDRLLPKIKEGTAQAIEEINKNVEPSKQKLAQVSVQQFMKIATEFLTDAQAGTMGLSLSDAGISGNMMVEMMPDSHLGKMFATLKNTDQPLLTGLPKENYLYFGGSVADGKAMVGVMDEYIAPILQELGNLGEDGKKLSDAINLMVSAMGTVDGGAFGVVAPTAALGQGPMIRFIGVYKGDSAQIKTAEGKGVDIINQAIKVFGNEPSELLKTTNTPEFKTISNVKFDRMQIEVNPDNTTQDAMHMSEGISQVFGPDGISILNGAVDSKTLIVALGIDDDLIGQAVDASRDNKDVMTEDLSAVDAGLPKKRAMAAYLGLGQIVSTALSYAKANGLNMPIQLPNNLPPIGVTFGTDGSTMRYDLFVPMKLMQSMVQAGVQAFMQFNGNRGGGGGGL